MTLQVRKLVTKTEDLSQIPRTCMVERDSTSQSCPVYMTHACMSVGTCVCIHTRGGGWGMTTTEQQREKQRET